MDKKSNNGRILTGKVSSVAMTGTVVVDVERTKVHRLYGKRFSVNHKIKAKNPSFALLIGDTIEIQEIRPQAKDIHFIVISKKE
ncbi:MAG: 30S ribosomal protein S17 [Candidatus Berkelbacteria bacterium]|nr:30S ribosomal protein S17 [Candidatus Berkelbacteria bacterium]